MKPLKLILLIACLALKQAICQQQDTNETLLSQPKIQNQANETTSGSSGSPLIESLAEQLIKQTNLQAEESRDEASLSVVAPPQQKQSTSREPVSFTGGSGNSYMSMSRDGSKRYKFGFDTSAQRAATTIDTEVGEQPDKTTAKRAPRLMREESRLEDGTVIGRYGYTDPFNVFRIVQYVAGADGYFAVEDVGALSEQVPGTKFQLNKQLHKALEQARSQRIRAAQSTSPRTIKVSNFKSSSIPPKSDSEPLTGSGSSFSEQKVSYATTINHLIGTNGQTYATAFRPVRKSGKLQVSASNYEPVLHSPDSVELMAQKLRSRLPAPIYKPTSTGYEFAIEHSPSGAEADAILAPQVSPAFKFDASQQQTLQASPAWSVLNNNYGGHQSALFIDHNDDRAKTFLEGQVDSKINENFEREAAALRSIRQSHAGIKLQQQQPQQHFGMAYNYKQEQNKFGARTSQQQNGAEVASDYNLGSFALKHFDPPLYHPEVHETRPVEGQFEAPVVYSSTVLHSEVAAERDYRPERSSSALQIGEVMQKSSSVVRQVESNNSRTKQLDKHTTQAAEALATTNTEPSPKDSIRYATRLSGAMLLKNIEEQDELEAENSEQVSFLSTSNGTSRSRAKMPDRTKKLSLIFKPRSPVGGNEESKIRRPMPVNIKRQLITANQSASAADEQQQVNNTGGGTTIEANNLDANSNSTAEQQPVSTAALQPPTVNAKPAKPGASQLAGTVSKKFGKGSNVIEKSQEVQEQLEAAAVAPVSAKKRPILREPKRIESQPVSIELVPGAPNSSARPSSAPELQNTTSAPKLGSDLTTTATIIDTIPGDDVRSTVDRELYEKIVKIQQEIAAKSLISNSVPETTTTTHFTPSATTQTPATTTTTPARLPTTTTTTSTTISTTVKPIAQIPIATTAIPSPTLITTRLPSTTTTTTKSSSTTSKAENFAKEITGVDSIQSSASASSDGRAEIEKNLLTGPLMTMDASIDQSEFLNKLTQDMDSFDSARGFILEQTASVVRPAVGESFTTTLRPMATSTTIAAAITTNRPLVSVDSQQIVPTESPLRQATNATELRHEAPNDASKSNLSADRSIMNNNKIANLKQISATASPASEKIPEPTTTTSTTTTRPTTLSIVTTISTTTTQAPTTTTRPIKRSTVAPRFGRLVIKRGDKVVARYNASEPIPDSMIPIGGVSGSEIIVPDMPRLGMRRSVKRRMNATSKTRIDQQSIVMTSPTTTTKSPTLSPETLSHSEPTNSTSENSRLEEAIKSGRQAHDQLIALAPPSNPRGLFRGPRSSSPGAGEGDLIMAESSLQESDSFNEQTAVVANREDKVKRPVKVEAAEAAITRVGGSNWSARIRESINGKRLAAPDVALDKKYDPKEDLKKLVEKIAAIENFKPLKPDNKPQVSVASGANFHIGDDLIRKDVKDSGAMKSVIQTNGRNVTNRSSNIIMQQQAVISQEGQNQLTNMSNRTTLLLTEANLPMINLTSNSSSNTSVPIKHQVSSSVAFTVTLSPALERQWEKLQPINGTSISSSGLTSTNKLNEVRVNSHGHIHVRNNQSITVHVDIEPPRRFNNSAPTGFNEEAKRIQKRLVSRDTTAIVTSQNSNDIQRLSPAKYAPRNLAPGEQALQTTSTVVDVNKQRSTPSADINHHGELRHKRKPRMLCIEVDSTDSNERQKIGH